MHEAEFSDAFMIPSFTVLGLQLRNYAIGHEIGLWKSRNPFVTQTVAGFGELPDMAQRMALGQAVDICCVRRPFWTMIWAIQCKRFNLAAEIAKFREYLAAGRLDLPTVKQPRTSGVPYHYFGAPEAARLLNYVTQYHAHLIQTHFQGSPLNFPVGLAKILYSTHLECEGAIWVENWQDGETRQRKIAYEKQNPESGLAVGDKAVQEMAEKWNSEHPDAPVVLPDLPKGKS